jgi:ribonuclease HI
MCKEQVQTIPHKLAGPPPCIQTQSEENRTLNPVRKGPGWKPSFTWHISNDKDEAMSIVRSRMDDIKIFTDGSGYEGKIASAAVLYGKNNEPKEADSIRFQLGSIKKHTVFEAEIVGVVLALHTIKVLRDEKRILIALDNQATIRALTNNCRQPGQYLLDEVHKMIGKLGKKIKIHLEWAPGHHDLEGNEAADAEAKRAASGDCTNSKDLPDILQKPLPFSIAAMKADFKDKSKLRWEEMWKKSPRFERFTKIDPNVPNPAIFKTLSSMKRQEASIVTQLRTNCIGLKVFLKKIKKCKLNICWVKLLSNYQALDCSGLGQSCDDRDGLLRVPFTSQLFLRPGI